MTSKQQLEHFEALVAKMRATLISKGDDYASGIEDRLINFKTPGALVGVSPVKVALTIMAVKISRLINLTDSKKTPNNESLKDNSLDLCVYAVLTDALLSETLTP